VERVALNFLAFVGGWIREHLLLAVIVAVLLFVLVLMFVL
jgi:hypothetical protein